MVGPELIFSVSERWDETARGGAHKPMLCMNEGLSLGLACDVGMVH